MSRYVFPDFLVKKCPPPGVLTGQKLALATQSTSFLAGIICFGIILRIVQYISNRSVWLDEAMLALNIINKPLIDLLGALDYHQGAPIGFLIVEKFAAELLGTSEYALRLFPLLSGITSLFLFHMVAKRFFDSKYTTLGVGLFAISYKLIYYSSEIKQYSSDVCIALALYVMGISICKSGCNITKSSVFGIIGGILIWFSHPAIFILSGIGISLVIFFTSRKEWKNILFISGTFLWWISSFIIFYIISLSKFGQNDILLNYWANSFMPFPPRSLADLRWFDNTFFTIFNNPVGLFPISIASFVFLVGCISMFLERRREFIFLISPIFFTLLASAFHRYPFAGRLLLFFVPFIFLFIVEGIRKINLLTLRHSMIVSSFIMASLLVPQLLYSSSFFIRPLSHEEIKPVLEYVDKHWKNGDILYLYHGAQAAFKFYRDRYGFANGHHIFGMGNRNKLAVYENEIAELHHSQRIWILFSHINKSNGIDDEHLFKSVLAENRTNRQSFKARGASVYLYELN